MKWLHLNRSRRTSSSSQLGRCRPVVEKLEDRRLLDGAFAAELQADLSDGPDIHPRIVINDNDGILASQTFGARIDAVALLQAGPFLCTGTLIATNKFLTAKHCTASLPPSLMTVSFGDDSNSPDFSIAVSSKVEAGGGPSSLLDGTDVALLTLSGAVPSSVATPLPVSGDTPTGVVAATVGYGLNGLGSIGHQNTSDDLRWAGRNTIDSYGQAFDDFGALPFTSNIFSTDFDDGTAGKNTLDYLGSSQTRILGEATTAPGDSGGPLLTKINGVAHVIGVLSGGTTANSVYGDISWWTGLSPFVTSAGGNRLDLSRLVSTAPPVSLAAARQLPELAGFFTQSQVIAANEHESLSFESVAQPTVPALPAFSTDDLAVPDYDLRPATESRRHDAALEHEEQWQPLLDTVDELFVPFSPAGQ